jgi:aromatic-L-amino-acid/L-tryptophan decarboxylase
MDPALFADLTTRVGTWIRAYHAGIEQHAVRSKSMPGDVLAALPLHPPRRGLGADPSNAKTEWNAVFDDLDQIVLPGLTHWQSPSFFAFFPANTSEPAMLGEMLAAGLGVQGMLWLTSPACTELEMRVMDWLGEAIGLPESFLFRSDGEGGGVIQGTASEAVLAAMVAARRAAVQRHRSRHGPDAPRPELVAYTSGQAHSSILKAAMVAGIADGPEDHAHIRLIDVDSQWRMRPDALLAAMREDLAAGRVPFFVAVTLGTTGVTAVDPLAEVAHVIRDATFAGSDEGTQVLRSVWIHVDAAHSGAMLVCPEHRWMIEGVEHADSFCFNPHKWLLTGFDCDAFWVRDRRRLIDAMSVTPEYLRNEASQSGQVVDYRDWHVPLGRRFRSLKLWLVMRHYGLEGLQAYIRKHLQLAIWFEEQVRADTRFELLAPRTTNLICFGLRPRSEAERGEANVRTRQLLEHINASGKAYVSHTVLPSVGGQPGRYAIRVAIGATRVEQRHVTAFWNLVLGLVDDAGSVVDVVDRD